jgi:hypothetical protein
MARDVTWLLSEDWELGTNGSNNNMLSDQVLKLILIPMISITTSMVILYMKWWQKDITLKPVSFIFLEITFDS